MTEPESGPPEIPAVLDVRLVALQEIDGIIGNELVLNEADTTALRGLLFAALSEENPGAGLYATADTPVGEMMSDMTEMELDDFYRARLDEEERAAQAAKPSSRRVLADIEGKRAIVDAYTAEINGPDFARMTALREAVEYLAVRYDDHPDYDRNWRPA